MELDNNVYRKQGKRYIPIGNYDWNGFPCDGVWLVQWKPGSKSSECILRIGDIPEIDINLYKQFQLLQEQLTNEIKREFENKKKELLDKNHCILDYYQMSKRILRNICKTNKIK